jgi:hypothetical protein
VRNQELVDQGLLPDTLYRYDLGAVRDPLEEELDEDGPEDDVPGDEDAEDIEGDDDDEEEALLDDHKAGGRGLT